MAEIRVSSSTRIEWRGEELVDDLAKQVRLAVDKTLDEAVVIARSLARVDTGEMRDSIHKTKVAVAYNVIRGTIVADAKHSIFNEVGTVKMSAKPFIRPAGDAAFSRLPGRIAGFPGRGVVGGYSGLDRLT